MRLNNVTHAVQLCAFDYILGQRVFAEEIVSLSLCQSVCLSLNIWGCRPKCVTYIYLSNIQFSIVNVLISIIVVDVRLIQVVLSYQTHH